MNAISEQFDPHELRQPPSSIEAEQYVIGAVLIDGKALANVADWLAESDFYLAKHRSIWQAVNALAAAGKPVDAVTVAEHLDGGADGLTFGDVIDVANATVSAANVVAYAEIVLEKSRLRQVMDLGTRLAGSAMRPGVGSADLVAQATHTLAQLQSENRGGLRPIKPALKAWFEDLAERYESGRRMNGRATPWLAMNELTHGLRGGELIVVAARPGMGKALALETPIPTPTGWTTMGALRVGDEVLGMDGRPVTIVAATPVMYGRRCFDLEFSDGQVITADADHQWLTDTRAVRRGGAECPSVKTTEQIFTSLTVGEGRANHSVRLCAPLELPDADLPIDPYILGYWLGDGHSYSSTITVSSEDCDTLLAQIGAAGYHYKTRAKGSVQYVRVSTRPVEKGGHQVNRDSLNSRLRAAGLLQNKHIPDQYLRASVKQRKMLLAGLLDSDGTTDKRQGRVCFAVTNKKIADGFFELAVSLGYRPSLITKRVNGRKETTSTCYMVGFMAHENPFFLKRKSDNLRLATSRSLCRYIVDVREVPSVPVRCIQVESEDHMYLAGRSMIPTHNSVLGFGLATFDALRDGGRVALFSLEMTISEYGQRSVAALGGASHEWLRAPDKGPGSDEQWNRVTGGMTKLLEANIVVDDTPGLTVAQIAARARRAHMQSPLSMVVVDHMHIVRIKGDNPVRELGDVSRALKALAKELNVPVVALAQLNRSNTQRADKRPTMADLRGSGEIEQDADYIFLLHRQDYYDDSDETGAVEIIVGKSRNAAANTIVLKNRLDVMRFDDWEGPLPGRDEPKKHWMAGRGFEA